MRRFGYLALWLYVFSLPWDHMLDFGSGIGEISRVLGVFSVLATLGAVLITGHFRKPAVQHYLAGGFLLLVSASWFWSMDQEATARAIRTFLQTMAVMWQVWELAPRIERIRSLLFAYVLGGYVSCWATVQGFRNALFLRRGIRFSAEGWNANDLAVALALGIPMAAYLGSTSRTRILRWACWGYLVSAPVAIGLTSSRAGAVVAAIGLGCALMLILQSRKITLTAPLLAVAIAAVLIALVPWTAWDRVATLTSSPDLNNRVPLWQQSLRIVAENPFRPVGAGASPAALGGSGFVAHNAFISVLLEDGILALMCFAALLASCVQQARRLSGIERWLCCSVLLCWAIGALSLSWEQVRVTWFVLACITAAIYSQHLHPKLPVFLPPASKAIAEPVPNLR